MNKISVALLAFILVIALGQDDIFSKYYAQSRKIAEAMTLDQKVGQMILLDMQAITNQEKETTNPQQAVTLALGSVYISPDTAPTDNGNLARFPIFTEYDKRIEVYIKSTEANWKKLTDRFQSLGITVSTKDSGKYKIKFLLATDAVRGDQHTVGSVLFPHNIGLSCSRNQGHFENIGFWTKQAVKRSGFNYVLAPTVAVSHNPQWGRFYQSLGQDDSYIEKYGQSYVRGLQDVSNGRINGALASAKHFFGDGSTLYGCNQGNSQILNFQNYIDHNIKGYVGSVKANVGSVMISYNAINWVPNAINSQFLLGLLRQDIGFKGFTISDYDNLDLLINTLMPRTFMNFTDQQSAYTTMVNAGTDVFMVSKRAMVQRLFKHAKKQVERGYLPQVRLVDAVTRILSVKMAMGLVQKVQLDEKGEQVVQQLKSQQNQIRYPLTSSGNEYQDSLVAVRESLVLLKNTNVLPANNLLTSIKYVILIGEKIFNLNGLTKIRLFRSYDNIGMQCGGWSVKWQGIEGNDFWTGDLKTKSNASSILDALKLLQKVNNFELIFPNYTNINSEIAIEQDRSKFLSDLKNRRKDFNSRNTLVIGTFGEYPYAETVGDVNVPYCKLDRDPGTGCEYETSANPYAPIQQAKTLKQDYSKFDKDVLSTIKDQDKNVPLISVLLSGRPVLIDEVYAASDSVIAAWLPGTSGGAGIVDAITGAYVIRPKSSSDKNTLSVDWPRDMSTLENFPIYSADGTIPKINDPIFPVGFGLSTDRSQNLFSI